MNSEPDLYPPDIETLTPDARHGRDRAMVGTFFVTLGSGLFLERALDNNLDYFWLAVGLALLVGWSKAPKFPMFAVGSIMTGFAVGGLIESLVSMPFEATISALFGAAGFFAVYARYPYKGKWALIGTGVMGLIAVAAAGVELIGLIPAALTSAGLPLLLIAGGALLLFRNTLPPKTVKIGLIVVAVMFVMSGASSVDEWNADDMDFMGPFDTREYTYEVTQLDDRQLVVESDEGSVYVRPSNDGSLVVKARSDRGNHAEIDVDGDEDTLVVSLRRSHPFGGTINDASWEVSIPTGTPVSVKTDEGLVRVDLDEADVSVETDEGAVHSTVLGSSGQLDVVTDEGLIQVTTRSELDPDVTASSEDGEILIDGDRSTGSAHRTGDGARLRLTSDEGTIIVVDEAA